MRSFVIVPAVSSTSVLLAGSTLLAFAFAAIATPLVGVVARRLGMLDMPGGRRIHASPIARTVLAGMPIDFANDPLSDRLIELSFPVAVAFTMLWIVGMNNALNFIDGLDGLAAGVAAIAAVTLGGLALLPQVSEPFVAWMGFSLAGAIAGFLLFNFHP